MNRLVKFKMAGSNIFSTAKIKMVFIYLIGIVFFGETNALAFNTNLFQKHKDPEEELTQMNLLLHDLHHQM
jgi:hypothetical protein